MRENTAEAATTVIYEAEWPGFEQEPASNNVIRVDLHRHQPQPDWMTMTEIFKEEETEAFKEADESGIYNYEIETQRPVPPLEEVSERVSWRQRVKRFMGRTNEKMRGVSISTFATIQAKAEQYYGDEELGARRKKTTKAVIGALAVGASAYMGCKGLASSGSPHQQAAGTATEAKAAGLTNLFDFTAFAHVAGAAEPHHAVHAAAQAHDTLVTVHNGDTPWSISERHLMAQGNLHPTDAQVQVYDQKMDRVNPIYSYGDDSSEYIPVGTRLRLP